MHSIHGRAPAIATGLAVLAARPLGLGRDRATATRSRSAATTSSTRCGGTSNITILLFNNQVYGLTKGQYSPTSPLGQVTGSTPMGSIDWPLQPDLGRARRGGDVRGALDRHRPQAPDRDAPRGAAAQGRGVRRDLQNCNVYNDGAFDHVRDDKDNRIVLEHGAPIRFGAEGEQGVQLRADGSVEIVDVADVGEEALLVHDAHARRARRSRSRSGRLALAPVGAAADRRLP